MEHISVSEHHAPQPFYVDSIKWNSKLNKFVPFQYINLYYIDNINKTIFDYIAKRVPNKRIRDIDFVYNKLQNGNLEKTIWYLNNINSDISRA